MAVPMGWVQMASGQNSFYRLYLVSFSVSEIVVLLETRISHLQNERIRTDFCGSPRGTTQTLRNNAPRALVAQPPLGHPWAVGGRHLSISCHDAHCAVSSPCKTN